MDFEVDEIHRNRSGKCQLAGDAAELDEIWRKRLKAAALV